MKSYRTQARAEKAAEKIGGLVTLYIQTADASGPILHPGVVRFQVWDMRAFANAMADVPELTKLLTYAHPRAWDAVRSLARVAELEKKYT